MKSIGVPYGRACERCWKASICPACGAHITLKVRKDFESFAGTEYAEHWLTEHEGKVEIGSELSPDGSGKYRPIVVDISAEGHDGVGKRVGLCYDRAPAGCPVTDR